MALPFQPAPDCAVAVINASVGTKNIANVLNFHSTGGFNQANLDQLAANIDVICGSDYIPIIHTQVTYLNVSCRGLRTPIDISAVDGTNTGVGTASGTGLNSNVSLCATLRTGFTGRSARGRFFAFPAAGSDLSAVNEFSTTYANALVAMLQLIQSANATDGWDLVVLSRFSAGVRLATATFLPVTDIVARNRISDSQRHRLPVNH